LERCRECLDAPIGLSRLIDRRGIIDSKPVDAHDFIVDAQARTIRCALRHDLDDSESCLKPKGAAHCRAIARIIIAEVVKQQASHHLGRGAVARGGSADAICDRSEAKVLRSQGPDGYRRGICSRGNRERCHGCNKRERKFEDSGRHPLLQSGPRIVCPEESDAYSYAPNDPQL
jgi:hypothetical protein